MQVSFSLKTISPCPVTALPYRVPSSFLSAPFMYWKAAVKSPQSFLFYRLNNPGEELQMSDDFYGPALAGPSSLVLRASHESGDI